MPTMIELERLSKTYQSKGKEVHALEDLTLSIPKGEFLVVRGASGCGKTTLLLMLGGMLRPSGGSLKFEGKDLYGLSVPERALFRATQVGFVFQMFHLIPYLNVLENVRMALGEGGHGKVYSRSDAEALLEKFGLGDRLHHRPSELSAGEKQRTALARALIGKPSLLLADEPTGNLDPENADRVIGHMSEFHDEGGTVVVVTHGHSADPFADRIVTLKQGRIDTLESKKES